MTSAMVSVRDKYEKTIQARALLDTCSTVNLITEKFAKRLNLPMRSCSMSITGITANSLTSGKTIQITIKSTYNSFQKTLIFLTVPKITVTPPETFPRELIKIPRNIDLADPTFNMPRPVDLLIGAGASFSLFSVGQINLSQGDHDLFLQKTRLGWVIAGSISQLRPVSRVTCNLVELDKQISKFWEIEEVGSKSTKSKEDIECEKHYEGNVSRDPLGRYIVRLAFKLNNKQKLGKSYSMALKRFEALERKLKHNEQLKHEYNNIIQEYIDLGHMTLCQDPVNDDGYYMPHHAVHKESSTTTKVRVVFDGSAQTTSGVSLNELLMIGPTIQEKLFIQLIKFRLYKYALTADIEKMYRQITLHKDDRRYQRILWRVKNEIKTFELNTVTFGVSSSPFLAIRTIHQLANDEQEKFPIATKALRNDLYVDDLLTGANTIRDARILRDQIITVLSRGGFHIRQWASNEEKILDNLLEKNINSHLLLDKNCTLKTLGISWKIHDDLFAYKVNPIDVKLKITKRFVLSEIAKIFDPLGLLAPVIFCAKLIMQKLWQCKLDWDESLPSDLHSSWLDFVNQLRHLENVNIERRLLVDHPVDIQIHGFCDASNVGYGACLYLRSTTPRGDIECRLICAKSKVAPLKTLTIPRLELCGALLLTRLYCEVIPALKIKNNKTVFWSDSTIVLCWLKTEPNLLKTYVANRVVEIQDSTVDIDWRHVRTDMNPADAVSRGQLPEKFIQNRQWFHGPKWLKASEETWPNENLISKEIPELKKSICLLANNKENLNKFLIDGFSRFTSYEKLKRIVAWIMNLVPPEPTDEINKNKNKNFVKLSIQDIKKAEVKLLKYIQSQSFEKEIKDLKTLSSKTRLSALTPFIDSEGVIRVGGRLTQADIIFSQKHPILLPTRHVITDLIIREIHMNNLHSGIQTTLYALRKKFWVLDGRNQVRGIIKKCLRCFRFNPTSIEYKMGELPAVRVQPAVAFANTGVDFCGPFYIKEKKHRNRVRIKTYVCVFVCMVIKAVHLEVVSDLTTEGFLAAFRRFAARRGYPAHVYSDNGTNFVGANNQLNDLHELFNSQVHKEKVTRYGNTKKVNWHFIPPLSPHHGGLWESTVKLFKHHLKRVVGEELFTIEAFWTLVTEIEGILNSRPLTALSSDPNDILALSPSHYLIGQAQVELPENDLTSTPANRLSSWQHIMKVRQDFWKRWIKEYLNEQLQRKKWTKDGENLKPGTIVLVKNKSIPCLQWPLGRIIEVHPGSDGVVRIATVKTMHGEYQRPVNLLSPLPLAQQQN